jgi:ketosteroid isomerase-like protein
MKAARLMALASLAMAASCADTAAARPDRNPAEMTVRQKFAAFDRHDADAIERLYAADAVLHSPDDPELKGNGPIAGTYRQLFAAIPDAKDEVQSVDAIGDKVYVQFLLRGHWQGLPDKALQVRIISVYAVRNDRIVEDTTYYDRKAR